MRSVKSDDGDESMQLDDPKPLPTIEPITAGVFARRPELSVFQYTTLPIEVQQALKSTGEWAHAFRM